MNKTKAFSYFLRKSPLVRSLLWISAALIFILSSVLFGLHAKKNPTIDSITPPVGAPGDLVIISGKDFGAIRDTSYVEFGGSKLTASAYVSWSDTEIKVVLPANVKDGLVVVETKDARSKPAFFANTTAAPVAVPQNVQTTIPMITGISPEKIAPGTLISISGVNFGNSRELSRVFFSTDREIKQEESQTQAPEEDFSFVEASDDNFDYAYWSDNEIRLYVPDGATNGYVYVETAKGKSAKRKLSMENLAGKKSFIAPRTYLIQMETDIDDTNGDKESTIILHCPRPFISPSQPSAQMTEYSPEPVIADFQHTIIHQTSGAKAAGVKKRFTHNFAVTVYEIRTEIAAAKLSRAQEVNKSLAALATRADECVPAQSQEIKDLAKSVVKTEQNPYNKAALLYNYMLQNYKILDTERRGSANPLDLLKNKKGDAYDFSMVYTALLRAAGIPALPDSGILVGTDLKAKNHWWTEFYVAGFGWIPVDTALGAGMKFQSWQKDFEPSQFYFGNLDAQHILFSRGWNEIKPSAPNNKTVRRPKSYALQSIWEEANGKTIKYSSYWGEPAIIGLY